MCQFYCPEKFQFRKTPYNGIIDSVEFELLYNSWVGDSLTPMRVQLFEITSQLTRDYYTNIDPTQFCDMQKSLGMQTYTAHDMTVSDSVRYDQYTKYQPKVTIKMPQELGQRIYDATIHTPEVCANQNAFNEFFPGLYITNTFGTGNILNVEGSGMKIFYKYAEKDTLGRDSIIQTYEYLSVTNEVVQLNRLKNSDIGHLLIPNDSIAYIKSPAGVYTELTIPSSEIAPLLKTRIISSFDLTLKALPQEDWKYAFQPPTYVLAIPKDSINSFFQSHSIENNSTSFLGTYNGSSRTYSFGNIARLLGTHAEKKPNEDLVLSIIPVERRTGSSSDYSGNSTTYTVALENYMKPAGIKIRIDKDAMLLRLTTIEYK
ncbi:MAG: DUF4270 domain-containing protein [Parabacteroides sp.]|nr:DUF4270 domain-containing protein [Parabacteroides sp.]